MRDSNKRFDGMKTRKDLTYGNSSSRLSTPPLNVKGGGWMKVSYTYSQSFKHLHKLYSSLHGNLSTSYSIVIDNKLSPEPKTKLVNSNLVSMQTSHYVYNKNLVPKVLISISKVLSPYGLNTNLSNRLIWLN